MIGYDLVGRRITFRMLLQKMRKYGAYMLYFEGVKDGIMLMYGSPRDPYTSYSVWKNGVCRWIHCTVPPQLQIPSMAQYVIGSNSYRGDHAEWKDYLLPERVMNELLAERTFDQYRTIDQYAYILADLEYMSSSEEGEVS